MATQAAFCAFRPAAYSGLAQCLATVTLQRRVSELKEAACDSFVQFNIAILLEREMPNSPGTARPETGCSVPELPGSSVRISA